MDYNEMMRRAKEYDANKSKTPKTNTATTVSGGSGATMMDRARAYDAQHNPESVRPIVKTTNAWEMAKPSQTVIPQASIDAENQRKSNALRNSAIQRQMEIMGLSPNVGNTAPTVLNAAGRQAGGQILNTAGTIYDVLQKAKAGGGNTSDSEWELRQANRLQETLDRGRMDDGTPLTENTRKQLEESIARYRDNATKDNQLVSDVQRKADAMTNSAQNDLAKVKEGATGIEKFLIDATAAAVPLAGDIAASAIVPGAGLALMGARSFGSGAQKARNEGASLDQQIAYGGATAATELLTEKLSNAAAPFKRAFGGGWLDGAISKVAGKLASTPIGKMAMSAGGEALEEMVSDAIEPMTELIYKYGDEPTALAAIKRSYGENFDWGDMFYDGLIGGTLGAVGGIAEGINTRSNQQTAPVATETAQEGVQPTTPTTDTPVTQNAAQAQETANAEVQQPTPTVGQTAPPTAPAVEQTAPVTEQTADPLVDILTKNKRVDQATLTNEQFDAMADRTDIAMDSSGKVYKVDPAQHIDQRNSADVGKRNINAFQFDHPELHTYYAEVAADLLNDLSLTQKGGETIFMPNEEGYGGNAKVKRLQRMTSDNIARLLDGYGLSYDAIEKALNAIVNNHGQENYAAAKRVELVIDDMLSNGYTNIEGRRVPANDAYISAKKDIPGAVETVSEPMIDDDFIAADTGIPSDNENVNTVGSKQAEFDVKIAQNQTHSTDPVFTAEEREMDGLRPEDRTHQVQSHKQTEHLAKERLEFDYDFEKSDLKQRDNWDAVDESMAQQILRDLTIEARNTGDYSEVVEWTKLMDQRIGEAGRTLNMAGAYADRPETIIGHAAETLDEVDIPDEKKQEVLRTIGEQAQKLDKTDPTDAQALAEIVKQNSTIRKTNSLWGNRLSKSMSNLIDNDSADHLRLVALAQIKNMASDQIRPTIGESIRSIRIQSMLSNIATITRNLTGNNVFDPIESLSNNVGLLVDIPLSKITGTRSIAYDKSWASAAKRKGAAEAAAKSAIEVALDADTGNAESRYGTSSNRTFKMSGNFAERFLSTWAKWQGYTLMTTDEFQKGGIRSEVQRGIDELTQQGKITDNSRATAGQEEALYATFQDENGIGKGMQKIQQAGNDITEGVLGGRLPIGLGDVILPFARVPGNLVARGTEYNPAGAIIRTGLDTVNAIKKSKAGKMTAADQAKIVKDIGRGTTGAGIVALFTVAALKGIVRVADDEDDPDKKALAGAEGRSGTQINWSALGRFLEGDGADWREGDILMSIGFLQPINFLMTTGALIAEDMQENGGFSVAGAGKASVYGMMQSLLEMPVMSSLQAIANGYSHSDSDTIGGKTADALIAGVSDIPASFIPQIVRATAKGMDNNYRDLYSKDDVGGQIVDSVKSGIPGLRETLPVKLDPMGREKTYANDPLLNILNATVLPGAINKNKQDDLSREIERVYGLTENADVYPRRNVYSISYTDSNGNSVKRELNYEERQEYLKNRSPVLMSTLPALTATNAYKSANAEQQANMLERANSYADAIAAYKVVGEKNVAAWAINAKNARIDVGISTAEWISNYDKYKDVMQTSSYDGLVKAHKEAGFTVKEYADYHSATSGITAKDETGNSVSGLKKRRTIEAVANLKISADKKTYLIQKDYKVSAYELPWNK